MASFVNSHDVIGEEALIDSIIDKSIVEYKDDALTVIGDSAFKKATSLKTVDVPNAIEIKVRAFVDSAVDTLVLRSNTVCTLQTYSWENTFRNTPIASGTGYIYVPSALIDTYKAATNWSTYADQFRALEDYTVDGTTAGELDETKI